MPVRRNPPYLDGVRLDVSVPRTAEARMRAMCKRLGRNPGEVVGAFIRICPDEQAERLIRELLERDDRICQEYRDTQRDG